MNPDTGVSDATLYTLVDQLSCGDLDEHEIRHVVQVCQQAVRTPEETLRDHYGADAAKVAQYDPDGVIAFLIFVELEDYFAVADNVDELYEQIVDAFEHPALPEYPYDHNDFQTLSDFYQWVDQQLAQHHEKYCLIEFGRSYTHEFQVILVYREQVDTILRCCAELGIVAQRAL